MSIRRGWADDVIEDKNHHVLHELAIEMLRKKLDEVFTIIRNIPKENKIIGIGGKRYG